MSIFKYLGLPDIILLIAVVLYMLNWLFNKVTK